MFLTTYSRSKNCFVYLTSDFFLYIKSMPPVFDNNLFTLNATASTTFVKYVPVDAAENIVRRSSNLARWRVFSAMKLQEMQGT